MANKTAEVDNLTKEYWKSLYSNSPEFADALTKEIKKRVVAELKRTAKKASKEGPELVEVRHIASFLEDNVFSYEGLALLSDKSVKAFALDLDQDGDVIDFVSTTV